MTLSQPLSSLRGDDYEQLYRLLVERQSIYALILLDENGMIRSHNEGVRRLFCYEHDDFIGRHLADIFTPEDRDAGVPEAELQRAREEGHASDVRWHLRSDGTRFFGQGVLSAIRDEAGQVLGFTKVVSDETVRKRLEDRLLESNAALGHFANMVSHDLQEPLRTVSNFIELLRRRLELQVDEKSEELFAHIKNATARMTHLVRSLLAYSRADIEDVEAGPVALDEAAESAIANLAQSIGEANGTITHAPLPTVLMNPTHAVQVLQNLLSNAIKYRRPGVPPRVHITAENTGEEWVIGIADNGAGFDAQHAEEIFRPFARLANQNTSGTGLGLAIARRVIERYGGRMWAESQTSQGSTFYFTAKGDPHPPRG